MADAERPAIDVETLFRDHYEGLVRFAYLLTGSVEVAEDSVAEVFRRIA